MVAPCGCRVLLDTDGENPTSIYGHVKPFPAGVSGQICCSVTLARLMRVIGRAENGGVQDLSQKIDACGRCCAPPSPAGFEVLNTKFATVGTAGIKQTEPAWGAYREIKDDRVDFASEYQYRGTYKHEFMMRATTVGTFARPPATAELMYDPQVNGSTAYTSIEVKPK